jgi:type I restriction enzyme S subunit
MSMTEKKKHLVPRLRFPEFRDAGPWEVRTLEDLSESIAQGGTPDTSVPDYWNGEIAWITPAEMGDDAAHHYTERTLRTITPSGLSNSSAVLLPVNSVIISSRAPIGYVTINKVPMATNQGCKGIVPKKGIYHEFLYFSLLHAKPRLNDLGAGAGFKEISASTLKAFSIAVPDYPEQQKIADCLSSLDEVIELETKKLEALKAHKRGLMQQLFPREGETTPRLRFPEFRNAGPWEVKRLGEIAVGLSSLSGKSSKDFGTGNAYYIPYRNVYENTFVDFTWLEEVDVSSDENQTEVRKGDILFTVSSETYDEAGLSSVVLQDYPRCFVNSFCTIYRPKPKCPLNAVYAGYFFRSGIVRTHFIRSAQGAIRFNLSRQSFEWTPVLLPTLAEQQKIADCLSSLDEVIELQAKKLEALKAHKKGLLQQLFPQEVTP